jgi:hypothetical protein
VWDCTQPVGYSSLDTDCDVDDPAVYPGAEEICDRKDSNCDGFIPPEEIDGDGDDVTICEGDCDDTEPTVYGGAPEACSGIDEDCDGIADNGLFTDMCPPPTNVAVTQCISGTPSECAIVDCDGGFFDIDTTYGTGCECQDNSAGSNCGTALSVGTIPIGGASTTRTGVLPLASSADWFTVHYPSNGRGPGQGMPEIKFASNPGNNYRFDVYLNCNGATSACGSGESPTGNTSWDFQDDSINTPFRSNGVAWPSNVYVRVYRINGGNNCTTFEIEFGR